jgi:hypothetical protein
VKNVKSPWLEKVQHAEQNEFAKSGFDPVDGSRTCEKTVVS